MRLLGGQTVTIYRENGARQVVDRCCWQAQIQGAQTILGTGARQKFLLMDHEALARRFRLDIDADFLYLTYFI